MCLDFDILIRGLFWPKMRPIKKISMCPSLVHLVYLFTFEDVSASAYYNREPVSFSPLPGFGLTYYVFLCVTLATGWACDVAAHSVSTASPNATLLATFVILMVISSPTLALGTNMTNPFTLAMPSPSLPTSSIFTSWFSPSWTGAFGVLF